MPKKKTHEEYVAELAIKNSTIEVVGKYSGANTKILHRCNIDGYEWYATPHNILNGKGCPQCGIKSRTEKRSKAHDEYVLELSIKNPNIEVIGRYSGALTKIQHHCLIHDVYWYTTPSRALQGAGCELCHGEKISASKYKTHEQYVDELSKISPHIAVVGKYIEARTPILHKCTIHNFEWFAYPDNMLHGHGCPKCNTSHGERDIGKWLDNNNVKYITQKTFDNCRDKKPLPFDFYLPEYNACIEFDGEQHFHPVEYFGGEERFETLVNHDKIKNSYCKNNDINLLRISYNMKIEEELNHFLFI